MKTPMIMTPGPTYIHEDVRKAMSREVTNPDLDKNFYEFYKETCEQLKKVYNTTNEVLILNGEGILGLEASCASLIEPGDRVLCIDNGIFGNGFADFAKIYGADVTYFKTDYKKAVSVNELEEFLKVDNKFKIATLVHCETPSGITNPVKNMCPLLNKYGIITVVDSVSALGGEEMKVDEWDMDIVLSGSQKCLSAAPGLTILSISEKAWQKINNRSTPIAGFYSNLSIWKNWYQNKTFPYTQPISDIYGLREAVDRILMDKDVLLRHKKIANATRVSLLNSGIKLYATSGYSNTVTTALVPEGISYNEIFITMVEDYNIMIAGGFNFLKDKVFRIGHMGENCREEKVYITLKALDWVLRKYGVVLKSEIHVEFVKAMKQ
ncbi:aminotransferase class V-fold PLP-dependent enzyme [Alkalibaculum sp. M08DMB]|uniref:Aminotransferase class V-fold PLP-dependent enzyme n=1 Tax=Alkalibaculum sporogenes TaxID=2655001 RepID=A0A6A7KA85_9FIRM|nr:alanine--glyoxylate aminotransferase family protein [Alkalibaculum sporogenes]MPW26449.1 aminotransferase class V-fold PLP-dependent enzyme [Alkalibaculum sporogenes]